VFKNWNRGRPARNFRIESHRRRQAVVDLALKVSDWANRTARRRCHRSCPWNRSFILRVVTLSLDLRRSPWAPLIAIAGRNRFCSTTTTNLDLLGILPFSEGQPWDLKFSRSGKLLLRRRRPMARNPGAVTLWNVETGEQIATVGKEYDAVLAADISPDQTHYRARRSGPVGEDYSTRFRRTGAQRFKKHTDWITTLAFSPNGEMLASADRNGGMTIWDADNGQELFTTGRSQGRSHFLELAQ